MMRLDRSVCRSCIFLSEHVVEEREEKGGGGGGRRTKDKRRKRFDSRVTLSRFLPPSANNPPPLSPSSWQQIPSEISQIHIPTISTVDIA